MQDEFTDEQIASWITPEDLQVWQAKLYSEEYGATYGSYKIHYKAAVRPRPNRISQLRMERVVQLSILARMKGEVPDDRRMTLQASNRYGDELRYWK